MFSDYAQFKDSLLQIFNAYSIWRVNYISYDLRSGYIYTNFEKSWSITSRWWLWLIETVVMDIQQNNPDMVKEYMVCDTILKTNQKLAQIKVDMSRHHQRLSNNESIKKGYKMQTDFVSKEIQELIRKNHHLETQLRTQTFSPFKRCWLVLREWCAYAKLS